MLATTGCSGLLNGKLFKERAPETPAPSEQTVDKSFFQEPSGKPKTFLCAWAPEITKGVVSDGWHTGRGWYTLLRNETMHCNVQFQITEDYLIAKKLNPSFLNQPERWTEFLKIPIKKHFYYELDKDQYGRDTNKWVENSSRSHWSARPKMSLDLSGVSSVDLHWADLNVNSSVEDIEWDFERGFLGFSVNVISALWGAWGLGTEAQARYRFNFLQFEHDPTFKKTPYHQQNAKYFNAIHVMGQMHDSVEPELYAAHWDLRKTHDLHLNGVPDEHLPTIRSAVEKWNKTLRKIGAIGPDQEAFRIKVANLKHPFDLRYPTLTWISDRRLSRYAALGIGMAHSDVRNGKILWGSVVLWGGMLERYVNYFQPNSNGSAGAEMAGQMTSEQLQPLGALFPSSFKTIPMIDQLDLKSRKDVVEDLQGNHIQFLEEEIQKLGKKQSAENNGGIIDINRVNQEIEALKNQQQSLSGLDRGIKGKLLKSIAQDLVDAAQLELREHDNLFADHHVLDFFGSSLLKESVTKPNESGSHDRQMAPQKELFLKLAGMPESARRDELKKLRPPTSAFMLDLDRTVENSAAGWASSPAMKYRNNREMLDAMVMDLTLHELGHFLGMGHQFKENIVPKAGTVPSRYVKNLQGLATDKNNFQNHTTVMGYRNGRIELLSSAETYAPGPHDELVLRYLYKGEYSTYDKDQDEFVFQTVPENGRIPERTEVRVADGGTRSLPTAYFPACNDFDASLGADPYCNRWDYGSSAVDIVRSYFQGISDNMTGSLFSLIGGGSNPQGVEGRLWHHALEAQSRVRMFYDEMRRRLRSEPHLARHWDQIRRKKEALMEFSTACHKADPTNDFQVRSSELRAIFADPDMVDLCRANKIALDELRFFLTMPDSDYTRIDHNNRYLSAGYLAGDTSWDTGHLFGSWYQMSNLPFKIVSMFTLTTANPHFLWWGLYFGPNPFYDSEENRFLYRTLYPREYTQIITSSVIENLRFEATGLDRITKIGRTLFAAGSMLPAQSWSSNDSLRVPTDFVKMLDQQTEFQFSPTVILISASTQDPKANWKPDHYKAFTATIYDFYSNKESVARNVYLLKDGDVFVWANGMFLFPITKIKFYNRTSAYVIAYKVSFDRLPGDDLEEDSVKTKLTEQHNQIANICVNGFGGNGLSNYFDPSNDQFPGFHIPVGIDTEVENERIGQFYRSIREAFDGYDDENGKRQPGYEDWARDKIPENYPITDMHGACLESLKGVGQILSGAALINGFWVRSTLNYVEK